MSLRARWLLASVLCSVLLAGLTAWWVTDWALHRHGLSHAQHQHLEPDFHAWMHEHLDITPEQHTALEPLEAEFEKERARLKAEIRAAGLELAEAIRSGDPSAPLLQAALEKLASAQARVQRLTLDHFFAMKRYLRPAQTARLLEWTHDSLTREP
ncbi:MAG: periplasmic heavy metal sensor [Prosthecobacter sp.]|nr:periplasmic heavy metal sensor [Prosthecobacter sp.]